MNKGLHMVAFILLVIGGLNWGLVGLFNFDLVGRILGGVPLLASLVYILVGLSALMVLFTHKKDCRVCGGGSMGGSNMGMGQKKM